MHPRLCRTAAQFWSATLMLVALALPQMASGQTLVPRTFVRDDANYPTGNNRTHDDNELTNRFGFATGYSVVFVPARFIPDEPHGAYSVRIDMNNDGHWEYNDVRNVKIPLSVSFNYPVPAIGTTGSATIKVDIRSGINGSPVWTGYLPVTTLPNPQVTYRSPQGDALTGYLSADGILDRPLVIVEGVDNGNISWPARYFGQLHTEIQDYLRPAGFDVFVYNYADGGADIRQNAMGLLGALMELDETTTVPTRVLGISMGGVVSRYALAWAEQQGVRHACDMFVSADAPQQGAWLSVEFQNWLKSGAADGMFGDEISAQLSTPASLQLLRVNRFDTGNAIPTKDTEIDGSPVYEAFFNELNALNGNGYPHLTRNIAVSNGRGDIGAHSLASCHPETFIYQPFVEVFLEGALVHTQYLDEYDLLAGSWQPAFADIDVVEGSSYVMSFLHFITVFVDWKVDFGQYAPNFVWANSALDLWDVTWASGNNFGDIVNWGSTKFDEIYVNSTTNHFHDDFPDQLGAIVLGRILSPPPPLVVPSVAYPTIQSAVDASNVPYYNHEVHVLPGTYTETTRRNILGANVDAAVFMGNQTRLIADGAPGQVVIDPALAGAYGVVAANVSGFRIEGFTVRGAVEGIKVLFANPANPATTIADCDVSGCQTGVWVYDADVVVSGGTIEDNTVNGIFVQNSSDVSVLGTTCRDNAEAGIYLDYGAGGEVRDCVLEGNDIGVLQGSFGMELGIFDSEFRDNSGAAIDLSGEPSDVWDNRLFDNGIGVRVAGESSDVDGNVIVRGSIGIVTESQEPNDLDSNTIVGMSNTGIQLDNDEQNTLDHNIIVGCGVGVRDMNQLDSFVSCNDVFGNGTNYTGMTNPTGTNGNISVNPRFCDPASDDYHISTASACQPGNGSCGLIGALSGVCPPDAAHSTVEFFSATGALMVVPNPAAWDDGGPTGDLRFQVTVRDATDALLPNVRVTWVLAPQMAKCSGWVNSKITNATGTVTIDAKGGGYGTSEIQAQIGNGPEYVSLTGTATTRSPDYDRASGNGVVNLADFVVFSDEYLDVVPTLYHDYDNNGDVGLGDLVIFSKAFSTGNSCVLAGGSMPGGGGGSAGSLSTSTGLDMGSVDALLAHLDGLPVGEEDAAQLRDFADRVRAARSEFGAPAELAATSPVPVGVFASPNPSRAGVTIRYNLPGATTVEGRIFDLSGRLVREIATESGISAGLVAWDGRDGDGKRVVPGIYFVSFHAPSGSRYVEKIVLQP